MGSSPVVVCMATLWQYSPPNAQGEFVPNFMKDIQNALLNNDIREMLNHKVHFILKFRRLLRALKINDLPIINNEEMMLLKFLVGKILGFVSVRKYEVSHFS